MNTNTYFSTLSEQIIEAGRFIDSKGWVPATSGNFSARLPDGTIAITVSGVHKGHLKPENIMHIDSSGLSLDGKKPSAETGLHTALYQRFPNVQCVLHPHNLHAVLISHLFEEKMTLTNYELLKVFDGIDTHNTQITIPIFPNDQNIPRLAGKVNQYLDSHSDVYAYIIAGHGIYTWGSSVANTLHKLEALDFLFACELHLHGVIKA